MRLEEVVHVFISNLMCPLDARKVALDDALALEQACANATTEFMEAAENNSFIDLIWSGLKHAGDMSRLHQYIMPR